MKEAPKPNFILTIHKILTFLEIKLKNKSKSGHHVYKPAPNVIVNVMQC